MLTIPLFILLAAADMPGAADVKAWRAHQEQKMRGDKSPFAVERVEILEGEHNMLGSAPNAAVKLPGEGIPAVAGEVVIRGANAVLIPASPQLTVNGKLEKEHTLIGTDWVALGQYRLQIRHPDGKIALRISNLKGPSMMHYRGLQYFDFDEHYRVPAQFTPASGKQEITVESSQGGPQQLPYAGKLTFQLSGHAYTLDAFIDDDEPDVLFIIFRDATSGKETYGVGRYVYVPRPSDGKTVLDFNKAFNPLCAYGHLFFCPIPPRQNHLPIAILAGEKPYGDH
jgi:uncharacterized protein (DUF1684 family)